MLIFNATTLFTRVQRASVYRSVLRNRTPSPIHLLTRPFGREMRPSDPGGWP